MSQATGPSGARIIPGWLVAAEALIFFGVGSFIPPQLLAVVLVLPLISPFLDVEFGKVKIKIGPTDWFFMIATFLIIVALINGVGAKELLIWLGEHANPFSQPSPSPTPTSS